MVCRKMAAAVRRAIDSRNSLENPITLVSLVDGLAANEAGRAQNFRRGGV
jgi:hypothetical protein